MNNIYTAGSWWDKGRRERGEGEREEGEGERKERERRRERRGEGVCEKEKKT